MSLQMTRNGWVSEWVSEHLAFAHSIQLQIDSVRICSWIHCLIIYVIHVVVALTQWMKFYFFFIRYYCVLYFPHLLSHSVHLAPWLFSLTTFFLSFSKLIGWWGFLFGCWIMTAVLPFYWPIRNHVGIIQLINVPKHIYTEIGTLQNAQFFIHFCISLTVCSCCCPVTSYNSFHKPRL